MDCNPITYDLQKFHLCLQQPQSFSQNLLKQNNINILLIKLIEIVKHFDVKYNLIMLQNLF